MFILDKQLVFYVDKHTNKGFVYLIMKAFVRQKVYLIEKSWINQLFIHLMTHLDKQLVLSSAKPLIKVLFNSSFSKL